MNPYISETPKITAPLPHPSPAEIFPIYGVSTANQYRGKEALFRL